MLLIGAAMYIIHGRFLNVLGLAKASYACVSLFLKDADLKNRG